MASGSSGLRQEKKHKISSVTRSVLKTVLERCKKESKGGELQAPIEDYEERASYYTGFPKSYIIQLNEESPSKCDNNISLNRIDILQCMNKFNLDKGDRTYDAFYNKLHLAPLLPFERFRKELSSMGFGLQKTTEGVILMEDPKITFDRCHYLRKILKCRELNKHVYYIDERIINEQATFKKPDIGQIDSSTPEMVLYHIMSKDGYGNNLFCYQVNREDFRKWLLHIVLPSLKPLSVIVLDNGPLHGTSAKANITKFESKNEMMRWLREYNIPCNNLMRRAELYDLIEKCSVKAKLYNVDNIFKSQGHEVIRLPSQLTEISLTDVVWKDIKNKLVKNRVDLTDKSAVKISITRLFELIESSTWKHLEKIIIDQENRLFKLDAEIELVLEKFQLLPYEYPSLYWFGKDNIDIEDSD